MSLFLTVQHLEIAVVRIGVDLRLFDILAASKGPMVLQQLQKETGAAPLLLVKESIGCTRTHMI
jgi:hypothetical protein